MMPKYIHIYDFFSVIGKHAVQLVNLPLKLSAPVLPCFKIVSSRGNWLAQLVEHLTLDLRVIGLSPTLGVELTFKKFFFYCIFYFFFHVNHSYFASLPS